MSRAARSTSFATDGVLTIDFDGHRPTAQKASSCTVTARSFLVALPRPLRMTDTA